MNNRNWLLFLTVATSLILFACKKETTVVQPENPAQTKAVFSNWRNLTMSGARTASGDTIYSQTIDADSLTQAVLDSGFVMSYVDLGQPGQRNIINTANLTTLGIVFLEIFSVGEIELTSFSNFTGIPYRYVIIKGGIRGGRLANGTSVAYTKEQVQAMSYEEVMKLLGKNP